MIDEKKIEEAADKFAQLEQIYFNEYYPMKNGFKSGINWFKDSLWHDASEEPKETDKNLLCQCSNGEYITHPFKPTLGEWHERCEFVGITRWLYIDDLMKGEK